MKMRGWIILSLAFVFLLTTNAAVRGDNSLPAIKDDQGTGQLEQTTDLKGIKVKIFYIDMPDREKAGNSNFNPVRVKVKAGDKVVWTNNDSRTHFITSMSNCDYPGSDCYVSSEDDEDELEDEEENESNLASDTFYFTSDNMDTGDVFTYTFEKVGVYKYYCFTHPLEMTGFIEVEEKQSVPL